MDSYQKTSTISASLGAATELLERFAHADIRYCHFKSNEHLAEGLTGDTDLDILVDRHQYQDVEIALLQSGYRRFLAAFQYPSVEDYIGCDAETGRLIHVHLHSTLVLGEKDIKGYHWDFAEKLLSTRQLDQAHGVFVSEPHHELLLLLVRSALKLRWRDYLAALVGKSRRDVGTTREFDWLKERTDIGKVEAIAADELGGRASNLIRDIGDDLPSFRQLRSLRSQAKANLAWFRVYTPLESGFVGRSRAMIRVLAGLNRRYLHLPLGVRRVHRAGGCVVAFLGMDGAGKSTVNAEVKRWLSWKLDVYPVYFGSGDGSASLLRWPLKYVFRVVSKLRATDGSVNGEPKTSNQYSLDRERHVTWAIAVWASVLALEKKSKLKRIQRARSRGMIVICDRYPQIQVKGYNDGPLLASWLGGNTGFRRSLAVWEQGIYAQATRLKPDIVVKLDLPPEVAAKRKPEMTIEELERRRQAVRAIHYGDRCAYTEIDASASLDQVLLNVKRAIWEQL